MIKDAQAVESLDTMRSRHNDELHQAMNRLSQKLQDSHNAAKNELEQIDADLFDEVLESLVDHLVRGDLARHHVAQAHFQGGIFRELASRFEALEKTTPKGKRGVVVTTDPNVTGGSRYRRVFAIVDITDDLPGK